MCQYSSKDGLANDWHLVHLGSRASGGAGLILVEASAVTPEGRITPGDMGIWGDQQIEPLARIARFLESQGTVSRNPAPPMPAARQVVLPPGLVAPGSPPIRVAGTSSHPVRSRFETATPPRSSSMPRGSTASLTPSVAATRRASQGRLPGDRAPHGARLLAPRVPFATLESSDRRVWRVRWKTGFACRSGWSRQVNAELPESSPLFVRISATDWVPKGVGTLRNRSSWPGRFCKAGVKLIDVSSGALVPYAKIPVCRRISGSIRRDDPQGKRGLAQAPSGMITDPHQANEIITSGSADLVFLAREDAPRSQLADPRPEGPQEARDLAGPVWLRGRARESTEPTEDRNPP